MPHYFNVVFDPDKKSITYDISITTEVSGYVYARVNVYAFGFSIITENIDFCSIGWKQFCPIYPGSMEIESIQYIDKKYVDMLPGVAFTFPDLDATVRLLLMNENNTAVGCLECSFSNGKTVSHVGAKWATAVVAGIGLLISSVLSLFGNSSSASRMSAMSLAMFTYFQSVIIISMLHVQEVPPIAGAWSENLAWSMGLIRTTFMQEIFRWYVQATGGTPSQYLTSSSIPVLAQRSIEYGVHAARTGILGFLFPYLFGSSSSPSITDPYGDYDETIDLLPRATMEPSSKQISGSFFDMDNVHGGGYLEVLRGIDRVGYKANIEPTAIVCTGFTFFVLCMYFLICAFLLFRLITIKGKKKWFNRTLDSDYSWSATLKGTLMRYIYIGFPQLVILSLWEFTHIDSPAVAVLAVLLLVLALASMGWSCYKVLKFGRQSVEEHNNAAAILYGESNVLRRYGFLYTMLDASKYWFCAVILGYILVKSIFVALAQDSGKTQAMACFLIDLGYTIYMGRMTPYLDKPTNIMSLVINIVVTLNSFFFTFFSGIYGSPPAVASVLGLVFFIMNAAFSLLLLIYILFFACVVIFSKNPDARFSPAKDDRASFRKKHQSLYSAPDGAQELLDLGQVARGHDANWASEMYKLKNIVDSSNSGSDIKEDAHEIGHEKNQDGTFGQKIKDTLTRGKSLLSRKGTLKRKKLSGSHEDSNSNTSAGHDTIGDLEPPNRFVQSGSGNVSIPASDSDMGVHRHVTSIDGSVDTSLYNNEATTPANIYKDDRYEGRYNYL
ncbi:DEKNAAC102832 [Brettanomyces naardenensis]|uniref:DEKNAAC102832 n=1 Tax=Brettanomyces naardenensis TaxID=13370 RepID=A0A448YLU0_BRENA|nr:DEKNAAC102832 [Brettanomyces naardenensis]